MALEPPVRALLEAKNFAYVGTVRKDGRAHVVPVWVHTDGDQVIVNTAEGRTWPKNLERDPRVTLTVADAQNPYEYAQIYGRVAERTLADGDDVIDALAKKYLDADSYPFRKESEQRVTYRIEPEKVIHHV